MKEEKNKTKKTQRRERTDETCQEKFRNDEIRNDLQKPRVKLQLFGIHPLKRAQQKRYNLLISPLK
jgi:hypothetical protein